MGVHNDYDRVLKRDILHPFKIHLCHHPACMCHVFPKGFRLLEPRKECVRTCLHNMHVCTRVYMCYSVEVCSCAHGMLCTCRSEARAHVQSGGQFTW